MICCPATALISRTEKKDIHSTTVSNQDPPAFSNVPEPAEFLLKALTVIVRALYMLLELLHLQHFVQLRPVSTLPLKKYVN